MKNKGFVLIIFFFIMVFYIITDSNFASAQDKEVAKFLENVTISKLREENTELKKEVKKLKVLNKVLDERAKALFIKLQGLGGKNDKTRELRKEARASTKGCAGLREKNEELSGKISLLEKKLRSEKAALYKKLGVAYTQAKVFDLAIKAFEESLKFNPDDAEVHYNLGLLYKHSQDNNEKSIYHFKRCLQLNPKAKNRKEIMYFIKMLSE